MSTNVKYLNQKDAGSSKNCVQKKFGLNSKAIPSKSFRQKIEKTKNSKQPLGVINENDINQCNAKSKNLKESQIKKTKTLVNKSTNNNTNVAHFHRLSSFNIDNESSNSNSSSKSSASSSLNLENLLINVNLSKKNKIDTDDYREMFSKYVRDDYSNSILQSLLEDEQVNENFLNSHKITERMRTRMVDWMIEVLSNYHCDESTYFESVNLMDRYFKQCDMKHQILQPPELHLIGVTSMFIASKYQDIYPLRLKIVKDKIAHNKLSCQEIKDKEDEITRYLDYNLGLPTMWDFINLYLEEIFYINCYVCVYLAKMNCHDYQLMQKKHSLLAASTIFVAIKICEQINKEEYINDYFTEKLNEISNNSENDIIKTAQKILYNAQNFDTKFSGLENLKKVHFNAIIELKETK